MEIKLRRRFAAPQTDDIGSILAALEANNPDDAAAAKQIGAASLTKRAPQDDLDAILAALEADNPDDAAVAKGLGKSGL